MKTILICGSSGNIGSFLFENLRNKFRVLEHQKIQVQEILKLTF